MCNLGSISLGKFVDATTRTFDYQKLLEVTRVLTRNLNRVIDINYYPVPEAKRSNLRHRPIGLGVQVGLPVCPLPSSPSPVGHNTHLEAFCPEFRCRMRPHALSGTDSPAGMCMGSAGRGYIYIIHVQCMYTHTPKTGRHVHGIGWHRGLRTRSS